MIRFIIKTILFLLIPFFILGITESLLPVTFFTHRHWEAIAFDNKNMPSYSPVYENLRSFKMAQGDLCHHTGNAILKSELWITDKLGFRNDTFIEQADILFIGDSFTAGSSLSQGDIISNKVKKKNTKLKVYNMASANFSSLDRYLKAEMIKKPKWVVFSFVERTQMDEIKYYSINKAKKKRLIRQLFQTYNANVYLDKALKFFSIKWLEARLHNLKGTGIPSNGNLKMFFLDPNQKSENPKIISTINYLKSYKKYCDSLGIKLLIVPMPNKETVYFEQIPYHKQPNYLNELDSLLQIENIASLNTLKIYNNYRQSNNKLLYHIDDTHWNANATELVSGEILKKIYSLDSNLVKK